MNMRLMVLLILVFMIGCGAPADTSDMDFSKARTVQVECWDTGVQIVDETLYQFGGSYYNEDKEMVRYSDMVCKFTYSAREITP